jgi:hypothetical protein
MTRYVFRSPRLLDHSLGAFSFKSGASCRGPIHVFTFGTTSILSLLRTKGRRSPADLAQDYLPALTTFSLCADEATWAATKRAIGTRKGEQET